MVVTGHPSWDVSGLILILEKHSGKQMTHGMPDFPEQSVRLVPWGTSLDHRVFLVAGLGLCAVLFNLCPVLSGEGFLFSPLDTCRKFRTCGTCPESQNREEGKSGFEPRSACLHRPYF